MTQSGQGEEPSRRAAREGIVLPSDGGEPLLPGPTGASGPAGGQAWDPAWGPGGPRQPPAGAAPWGAPGQHGADAWYDGTPPRPGAGPLPPEDAHAPGHGAPHGYGEQAPPAYGGPQPGYGQAEFGGGQYQEYGSPQPGYGGQPPAYGSQPPAYDAQQSPYAPQGGHGGGPAAPSPPAHAQEPATQYLPPVPAAPAADEGATQYIPHIPPAPADEGATQYLPPVSPGALPPEQPAQYAAGQTRPPGGAPSAAGSDAEATQYIPPVPGQPAGAPFGAVPGAPHGEADRQPPAEFDNLFRGAPSADGSSGSTQQMPVVGGAQPPGPGGDPSGYAPRGSGGRRGGRGGRTGSRAPLIAAVGVALAVVGVGTGALLAGGDGEDDADQSQTVSATAPATESSASASVDPAREQAVALDELLADSGDSRQAVIDAVADVKSCDNLSEAAQSLRDAAQQRTELVTRLAELSVDELPGHAELSEALTKAWQASASADNHYAAWADQAAGKKGCKKGQARTTGQTEAGNKESGVASTEKAKAAELWNEIAKKWGLTERTPVQL